LLIMRCQLSDGEAAMCRSCVGLAPRRHDQLTSYW
jgi:hypothetical protein